MRIAIDVVGPLPRSSSGNKYILVVCDYATRYQEAIPMISVDAEHVAEALATLFAHVGVLSEILTDQETHFMSKLLSELYRLLHVRPIRTSPYHPQTDGLVERFNRTLKSMHCKTSSGGEGLGQAAPISALCIPQAELTAPLTDLTRKRAPNHVQWTEECDGAFNRLKQCLCCEPILRCPNFSLPFVLQMDTSRRAIGAVLSQAGGDGEEHPVAYYSRKLLPREEKYSTVEKECLAIILMGIQTF